MITEWEHLGNVHFLFGGVTAIALHSILIESGTYAISVFVNALIGPAGWRAVRAKSLKRMRQLILAVFLSKIL